MVCAVGRKAPQLRKSACHFVMERQYRHALGCTCYELPCGVMEEGETPLEAAQRELEEEVRHLLRNNEMMQSFMVAPLLKYLSLELK